MKNVIALFAIVPVAAIKAILVIVGLIVVPVMFSRGLPALYRIGEGRPQTIWEAAIRNPVGGFGFLFEHPEGEVYQIGEVLEATETTKTLQARCRTHKYFASVRFLWKYSETRYGELYIGWKLNSAPPEFDFALSARVWAKVGE